MIILSRRQFFRLSAIPPVAGFQGKVAQCIIYPQLATISRHSVVASRQSLAQSRCVYPDLKGQNTNSDFDFRQNTHVGF